MWKKLWKRLIHKHRNREQIKNDLVKQNNGYWRRIPAGWIKESGKNDGVCMWKRLRCKHRHQEPIRTDLWRQNDGSWRAVYTWRCKDCGKIL